MPLQRQYHADIPCYTFRPQYMGQYDHICDHTNTPQLTYRLLLFAAYSLDSPLYFGPSGVPQ